ncbi:hypothetical protein AB4Z45_22120 [Paenibacillus sp. MCAF9]|uniref:hypothetical protein n=1 Tax=unclassified Paenibacillus TaxID=185978 RepID=UPI003F9BB7A6
MLKKKAQLVFAMGCFAVVSSFVMRANWDNSEVAAAEQRKENNYTVVLSENKQQNEHKQKELASKLAQAQEEMNPTSSRELFDSHLAGYKDLYVIESTAYNKKKDSTDPLIQKVLHELEEKGKLIAHFEKAAEGTESGEELLKSFIEATNQLNRELYPERYNK